jgi:hypothetical protein
MRLSFRLAVPADWNAIVALHNEQQAEQKSNFELPWLFRHPIVAAIVGEDEHGVIRHCFYGEAVVEMRHVGCNARCTALAQRESEGFAYLLRALGYRWLECFIPRRLARNIGKPLRRAKFVCVDKLLAHYTRDLR